MLVVYEEADHESELLCKNIRKCHESQHNILIAKSVSTSAMSTKSMSKTSMPTNRYSRNV